jgi:hypothetical protein
MDCANMVRSCRSLGTRQCAHVVSSLCAVRMFTSTAGVTYDEELPHVDEVCILRERGACTCLCCTRSSNMHSLLICLFAAGYDERKLHWRSMSVWPPVLVLRVQRP